MIRPVSWAKDGFNRAFLFDVGTMEILICGLPNVLGVELKWLYEETFSNKS